MSWIDLTIIGVGLVLMVYSVMFSKRYMKSVADFLSAGRTAGRYIISVSMGMAMLGSITVIGEFQLYFKSGFCLQWWQLSMAVAILIVTVSGWVYYRFRQTRALTLAQFFETRYSRKFRIFAGLVAFLAGIINFGIFPAVGARFFIYFCNLPTSFSLLGLEISTFALLMLLLLGLSLYFVFGGGQIAVIITDFLQGLFSNAVFIIMVIYFLVVIDWSQIASVLTAAPPDASLIDPFKTSRVEDFNFWYFLIGLVGFVYNTMSWQGTQGYNSSAKSAHESKMAQVLGNWRNYPRTLFMVFIPIVAITVLAHPNFMGIAQKVNGVLATIGSTEIKSQMEVPLVLRFLLPKGMIGAFVVVMLAAFLGNHATYLHSWGSIFIQDVIMPFRRKPFSKDQHIRALRWSITAVAVFIFFFSLLFKQSQNIYLFFAITGAIFAGGSGAVIIGGLYWKRGTTAAAWSAMLTGSTISVGGIILHQIYKDFPINGQWFWGISIAGASLVYVLVSLLGKRKAFDLDRLLHRGKYAIEGEMKIIDETAAKGWKALGMGKEFTRGDKFIYISSYAWTFAWTLVFIIGTIYNLTSPASPSSWMDYWKYFVYINLAISIIVIIWFGIGGIMDMKSMFKQLKEMKRDDQDDGFVSE